MSLTVWNYLRRDGGLGGISPADEREFVRSLTDHGHAIVTSSESSFDRSWNHRIIGTGVGHDDAKFCESGESMAAYYENGDAWDGRWFDDANVNGFFPTIAYYDCTHPNFPRKTGGHFDTAAYESSFAR